VEDFRKIIGEIRFYLARFGDHRLLIWTGILLAGLLGFNYSLDFEDNYIDQFRYTWKHGLLLFLYQAIPYLITCFLLSALGLSKSWMKSTGFWIYFMLGFAILAVDRSWNVWHEVSPLLPPKEVKYIYSVIVKGKSFISMILPLMVFFHFSKFEKDRSFFGLWLKGFVAKPYLIILAIAMVCVFIGGFFSDLQEYYPRYAKVQGDIFASERKLPEYLAVLMYEFAYGLDFISTELFFRGFLVLGMVRFLGPYAIYPMVVAYCVLHFGKPPTEAISSIFGGGILGVIALYHRNIWGGVIIHVGVAWTMEAVGALHRIWQL
jgi:hypothetical protein